MKVLARGHDGIAKWSQPHYFGNRGPCICTNVYVATQMVARLERIQHFCCLFVCVCDFVDALRA